jgi:hypothetical protein
VGDVEIREQEVATPWQGVMVEPVGGSEVGLLVLAGSSGRVEHERARVFARQGVTALAIKWFGGPGQPPGICEVPLETFIAGVDLLRSAGARRIGVLGVSKGAEAALLTAVHDPRVDVVAALSPSSHVWGNVGPGFDGVQYPFRSSWTWRARPLPFVPLDGDSWAPGRSESGPVAILGWYEQSRRTFADLLPAAEIPVDRTAADILLVAGGDDAMWPSVWSAELLTVRRHAAGLPVRMISRADAGHRPRFPGESPARPSPDFLYGGTPHADARLGATAWPLILASLRGEGS